MYFGINQKSKQTVLVKAPKACSLRNKTYLDFNAFVKSPGISTNKRLFFLREVENSKSDEGGKEIILY